MAKQDLLDWIDEEIAYSVGDRKEAMQDVKQKAEYYLGGAGKKHAIPTKADVEAYFKERGEMIPSDIPLEAENFCNHHEEQDWKKGGKRIKYWKRQAATWNNNYRKYNRDRINRYEQTEKTKQADSGEVSEYDRSIFDVAAN